MEGWIKLHRNILNWRWATSSNHFALFVTLLLRANYKATKWRKHEIKPGQLVTGRKQLADWTGLSEMQIRIVLRDLKDSGEINQQITSKFSIITLCNWEKYQVDNQQITSKQPADNQQITTSKNANNINNENNGKNITLRASPLSFLFDQMPDVQDWLNNGSHDTHSLLLSKFSPHVLAEEIPKLFVWAHKKQVRAESWMHTKLLNVDTQGFGANQAKKSFSSKTNTTTSTLTESDLIEARELGII